MVERKADSMSDETQDTRAMIEMEAGELVADYAASGEVCDKLYNGILELLDRQAAITEREFADGQEIIDEQQSIIELQEKSIYNLQSIIEHQEKRIYNLNGKVKNIENNYGQLKGSRDHWRDRCKELERKLEDEYIKLPVDADGVPWHIGDVVHRTEHRDHPNIVTGVEFYSDGNHKLHVRETACTAWTSYASEQRHFKPDIVENLLAEYVERYDSCTCIDYQGHDTPRSLLEEYAERIKELIQGNDRAAS